MTHRLPPSRIQRAVELRRLGHSYSEIARIMGLGVSFVTNLVKPLYQQPFECSVCGKELALPCATAYCGRSVLCLGCLADSPNPSFADRLVAHRIAAGYSLSALARRTQTVCVGSLRDLERGRMEPSWRCLVALVKVLGLKLLLVPSLGPVDCVPRMDRAEEGEAAAR